MKNKYIVMMLSVLLVGSIAGCGSKPENEASSSSGAKMNSVSEGTGSSDQPEIDSSSNSEEYETGRRIDRTDPDAPKYIESDVITNFYLSYERLDMHAGSEVNYSYEIREVNGEYILVKGSDTLITDPTNPRAISEVEIQGVNKLVEEYELAKLNGIYVRTDGLPPIDGDYILDIRFDSGESIAATENGGTSGRQREGFDKIRRYLERLFLRDGDISSFTAIYPVSGMEISTSKVEGYSVVEIEYDPDYGDEIVIKTIDTKGNKNLYTYELDYYEIDEFFEGLIEEIGLENLMNIPYQKTQIPLSEKTAEYKEESEFLNNNEIYSEYTFDRSSQTLVGLGYEDYDELGSFFYLGSDSKEADECAKIVAEKLLELAKS